MINPFAMRALTESEIRNIIRENPVPFVGMANTGAAGGDDLARAITLLITKNDFILGPVLAVASNGAFDASRPIGQADKFAAIYAAGLTRDAHPPELFARIAREELSMLTLAGQALQ